VTFFLVILLTLVAGIVEVGAVMNAKLTVVNSAREGTRFATVGASDDDVTLVTQAATSSLIAYEAEQSDIWVIHAKTDDNGNIGDQCLSALQRQEAGPTDSYWCVEHTVGEGEEAPPFVTKADVKAELTGVGDTEVVGVAVAYDHQSLVGLPFIDYLVGAIPINSFTLMRVDKTGEGSISCPVWPIGISQAKVDTLSPGDLVKDNIEGGGAGSFGWLSWNGTTNSETLEDSLKSPLGGSCIPGQHGDICYTNAADADDHSLSIDDWTHNATGWMQSATDEIDDLDGRFIRIIIWDTVQQTPTDGSACTGNACVYHVSGYAIIQLRDIDGDGKILTAGGTPGKTLEGEFIRVDTACK
jgi:hypothetical protein